MWNSRGPKNFTCFIHIALISPNTAGCLIEIIWAKWIVVLAEPSSTCQDWEMSFWHIENSEQTYLQLQWELHLGLTEILHPVAQHYCKVISPLTWPSLHPRLKAQSMKSSERRMQPAVDNHKHLLQNMFRKWFFQFRNQTWTRPQNIYDVGQTTLGPDHSMQSKSK